MADGLTVRTGRDGGQVVLMKCDGYLVGSRKGTSWDGTVVEWTRAVLRVVRRSPSREEAWMLVPGDVVRSVEVGSCRVEGRFDVAEVIEGAPDALRAWDGWVGARTDFEHAPDAVRALLAAEDVPAEAWSYGVTARQLFVHFGADVDRAALIRLTWKPIAGWSWMSHLREDGAMLAGTPR